LNTLSPEEINMIRLKTITWFGSILAALVLCFASAHATDIGGTISVTLTITENSQLVDDVTCTVTGAPCIAIAGSNVTLELNGFTMTGQADARTACVNGTATFSESGIDVESQTVGGIAIHGPGLVQRFRGPGIFLHQSTGVTVTDVTLSTNCFSGILIVGGSGHEISGNISVRNGNPVAPCGGI
jgi:hypothetical protein